MTNFAIVSVGGSLILGGGAVGKPEVVMALEITSIDGTIYAPPPGDNGLLDFGVFCEVGDVWNATRIPLL